MHSDQYSVFRVELIFDLINGWMVVAVARK